MSLVCRKQGTQCKESAGVHCGEVERRLHWSVPDGGVGWAFSYSFPTSSAPRAPQVCRPSGHQRTIFMHFCDIHIYILVYIIKNTIQ